MKVPVGLSNHHVHVTREVGELLFGKGYKLTVKRPLKQKGEFACEETVDVIINNYKIEHVRLIGPYRKYTQLELLSNDCKNANIEEIRRNSGDIEGTHPFKLVSRWQTHEFDKGAFVANNHVHLSEEQALEAGLNAGDTIKVETKDGVVLDNIFVKSDPTCEAEFHMNKDEGEALNILLYDEVTLIK